MSKIEQRLTRQLVARGVDNAKGVARSLLIKRGHVTKNGALTAEGKKRQEMGNDGRAIDRAKSKGHSKDDYKYNKKTNRATLKKGD